MSKNDGKIFITNRKANFEYTILDTFEAGLMLLGSEVKMIVSGQANIGDAYVIERDGELWIQNSHVSKNEHVGEYFQHDPMRLRKLLMHKKEISKIIGAMTEDGYTVVILNLHANHNKIKALIGLAKGKKSYDKRASIKERENNREISRAMRGDY